MAKYHTKDIIRQWDERISRELFEDAIQESQPVTVFLGGQSGAGKTRSVNYIQHLYREDGSQLIYVNADDLRQYHPDFRLLMESDPLGMPSKTGRAVSQWTSMAIEQANRDGYSIIVESTWNTPERVLDQMRQAKDAGRFVHVVGLATPPVLSRLAILERYYNDRQQGKPTRWVSPAFHDRLVGELPEHVRRIAGSGFADLLMVIDRDGDPERFDPKDVDAFDAAWFGRFRSEAGRFGSRNGWRSCGASAVEYTAFGC